MHVSTGASIAFWIIAAVTVASALGVILIRDIFRAALLLVVTFLSMAGLFVTLNADFVAAAQVLIYAGAISILLIFAVLLTRDVQRGNPSNRQTRWVVFLGVLFAVTLIVIFTNTKWTLSGEAPAENTTALISDTLFDKFILPFEIASVVLVAAVIGAIVIAKENED
ncbi:MAG: NADH-quinone oxidoreductase subunit L [Chloroflexi bacterium]|nr:NADH-quinone oxidoreductase subunit L [Chloroflexota bacterium]